MRSTWPRLVLLPWAILQCFQGVLSYNSAVTRWPAVCSSAMPQVERECTGLSRCPKACLRRPNLPALHQAAPAGGRGAVAPSIDSTTGCPASFGRQVPQSVRLWFFTGFLLEIAAVQAGQLLSDSAAGLAWLATSAVGQASFLEPHLASPSSSLTQNRPAPPLQTSSPTCCCRGAG